MYNEVSFSLNSKSFAEKLMKLEIIQMNEPDSDKFHILSHMQTLYIYIKAHIQNTEEDCLGRGSMVMGGGGWNQGA